MRADVTNYHWPLNASCEQWVRRTLYIFLARPKLLNHGPIASYKPLRFFWCQQKVVLPISSGLN